MKEMWENASSYFDKMQTDNDCNLSKERSESICIRA